MEVDVHKPVELAGESLLHCVPVEVGQTGQGDLVIGVVGGGVVKSAGREEILQAGDYLLAREHHACDGLADNTVERDEDGKGDKRPQAAGHGVDAFLAVELLHLRVELLLVALMPLLQLRDTGLET